MEFARSADLRYTARLAELSLPLPLPVPMPGGDLGEGAMPVLAADFERRYAEMYGEGTCFSAGVQAITFGCGHRHPAVHPQM